MMREAEMATKLAKERTQRPRLIRDGATSPSNLQILSSTPTRSYRKLCLWCVCAHVPEMLKCIHVVVEYTNVVCNAGFEKVCLICVNLSLTLSNTCICRLFLFQCSQYCFSVFIFLRAEFLLH